MDVSGKVAVTLALSSEVQIARIFGVFEGAAVEGQRTAVSRDDALPSVLGPVSDRDELVRV